jgi:hypothetical protein
MPGKIIKANSCQTIQFYFAQEIFPWEKWAEMSDIFTDNSWQTKGSYSQKGFCQIDQKSAWF